ncbi:MAG: ISH3 family transposase [Candidatus Thorarchaeota archaeon]
MRKKQGKSDKEPKVLKAEECFVTAVSALERHIPIEMRGDFDPGTLFGHLVAMSVQRQSIHSMDGRSSRVPTENAVRYHLGKLDMDRMGEANSTILTEVVGSLLREGRRYVFAIDFTDDPYYGRGVEENAEHVVSGRRKRSTNRFYRYASLYIVDRFNRITLSVVPVRRGTWNIDYIREFVSVLDDLRERKGIGIEALLLDRGFYSTDIFSFLQGNGIPYIVPVRQQGREMMSILDTNRTRYASYTMDGRSGSVDLTVVVRARNRMGTRGRHGRVAYGYVVHGVDWTPRRIFDEYRKRFAIESSYRIRNMIRTRTSTRDPTIRYLYAIVSMLLKNVWVDLQWRYFTRRRRGLKTVDEDRFRFDLFRLMSWRYACVFLVMSFDSIVIDGD